jgi:hypothetical protein
MLIRDEKVAFLVAFPFLLLISKSYTTFYILSLSLSLSLWHIINTLAYLQSRAHPIPLDDKILLWN